MGKKKRRRDEERKPWCYYCDRQFADETTLILHQKAKHFKCSVCHKKMTTAPSLAIHCSHVHKSALRKVPNAKAGRDDVELEIFGMAGVPDNTNEASEVASEDESVYKSQKIGITPSSLLPPNPTGNVPAAMSGTVPTFRSYAPHGSHFLLAPPQPNMLQRTGQMLAQSAAHESSPHPSGFASAPPLFPIAERQAGPLKPVLAAPQASNIGIRAGTESEESAATSDAKLIWNSMSISMEEVRAQIVGPSIFRNNVEHQL